MPINNLLSVSFFAAALLALAPAVAQQDTAVGDAEIRVGNIMPYTGPLAAFATIGKAEAAYFDMVNERGGINGRKIKFISVDNSSKPEGSCGADARAGRKEKVLFMFGSLGTPDNLATRQYLNERKIPQFSSPPATRNGRIRDVSMDHGMAAGVPDRGPGVRKLYPGRLSRPQDRGALGKRSVRARPVQGT